jgi:phage host-nuclease inhibitor protein Gam
MRTTLTIDEDVAVVIARRRKERETGLKEEINHLLRVGLAYADAREAELVEREPFRTRTLSTGRMLFPVDDVEAAIQHAEGPWHK